MLSFTLPFSWRGLKSCALFCLTLCLFTASAWSAVSRHAPDVNGLLDGDIYQLLGNSMNLNSGGHITGTWYLPGTPTLAINGGTLASGGIVQGTGSPFPEGYLIRLNPHTYVEAMVDRTALAGLPTVAAPQPTHGSCWVNLNHHDDPLGDPALIRGLNINQNCGEVFLPPGQYQQVSVSHGSTIVLGVAGSTEASVYEIAQLNLNQGSELKVLGPVVLRLQYWLNPNGTAGVRSHPEWLRIEISHGGMNINRHAEVYAVVICPNHSVQINGLLEGAVYTDLLRINNKGIYRERASLFPPVGNSIPVADSASFEINEDDVLNGILTASDSDGHALTFSLMSEPEEGIVEVSMEGVLVYTPPADFNGAVSFEFSVSDGQENSAAALVEIIVLPVNDSPIAQSLPFSVLEDAPADVTVEASDVDGDVLSSEILSATHGILTGALPSFIFTPDENYAGPASFLVRVTDGNGGEALVDEHFIVGEVNDPPVLLATNFEAVEDTPMSVSLEGIDIEGEVLVFVLVEDALHGVVTVALDGSVTYDPELNFFGADAFKVSLTDSSGAQVNGIIAISVTPVNDAPEAEEQSFGLAEDDVFQQVLGATDVDEDPLTFSLEAASSHGTVVVAADGSFTFEPEVDYNGPDDFSVLVDDGNGGVTPFNVLLSIEPRNDAPLAESVIFEVNEDELLASAVEAFDVDEDALIFHLEIIPEHGTATVLPDGSFTYLPEANFAGTDAFTVSVTDGIETVNFIVTVDVRPVNDAPEAENAAFTVDEDDVLSAVLTATDTEGSMLTFSLLGLPANGVATLQPSGPFDYTPNNNFSGSDIISVEVSDGELSAIFSVDITVNPVNDAPVLVPDSFTLSEDGLLSESLEASDVDEDALIWTVSKDTAFGAISIDQNGVVLYQPFPDFFGSDDFEITVDDGDLSDTQVFHLTVYPVNDAPFAENASFTTDEDTALTASLSATDIDGDALTFTLNGLPTHGIVAVSADGTFTYTPNANFNGIDNFTVSVSDTVTSVPLVVSITVNPVNEIPGVNVGNDLEIFVSTLADVYPGKLVVNSDEWTLSNTGFGNASDTENFARNLGEWFKRGEVGKFLVYSNNFGLVQSRLEEVMIAEGHSWKIDATTYPSFEYLAQFDAVFVSDLLIDLSVLTAYLRNGGSVYLCGGYEDVDAIWNLFLSQFNIKMGEINPVVGVYESNYAHPLMEGVDGLYYFNGNTLLSTIDANESVPEVIHSSIVSGTRQDHIMIASTGAASVDLDGSFELPEGVDEADCTISWSVVSGPGSVRFERPNEVQTRAFIDEFGVYILRLTLTTPAGVFEDDLELAIIENSPPCVDAGPDLYVEEIGVGIPLIESVTDDGVATLDSLWVEWAAISKPDGSNVQFFTTESSTTIVEFSHAGRYLLELSAGDGIAITRDTVEVWVSSGCDVVADASLVEMWSGNDTFDSVFGDHSLLVQGAVTFGDGEVLDAFWLPGGGASLSAVGGGSLDVGSDGNFTVECWINPDQIRTESIWSWPGAVGLRLYSGKIYFEMETESGIRKTGNTAALIPAGKWSHIGMTYSISTGEVVIYVNGALAGVFEAGSFIPDTTGRFVIGDGTDYGYNTFMGKIDELSIYSQALSATDIYAVFAAGDHGKCTNLIDNPPVLSVPRLFEFEEIDVFHELSASIFDPEGDPIAINWALVNGPGEVSFIDSSINNPIAVFSAFGIYTMEVTARSGIYEVSARTQVRVGSNCAFAAISEQQVNWSFEESLQSFENIPLVPTVSPVYMPGIVGWALSFDGINQSASIFDPDHFNVGLESSFSVETWLCIDRTQVAAIFSWESGSGARVSQDYVILEFVDTANVRHYYNTHAKFIPGAWHHLAIVFDRNNNACSVFLDGFKTDSFTLSSYSVDTRGVFSLGRGTLHGVGVLDGALDEFSICSRGLSSSEIASIFSAGSLGKCPPTQDNGAPYVCIESAILALGASGLVTWQPSPVVYDDGLPVDSVLTYAWMMLDGPAAIDVDDATVLSSTMTFTVAGSYVLELAVSDGELTTTDSVTVTVLPRANTAPSVALPDDFTVNVYEVVDLFADLTDDAVASGGVVSTTWTVTSGVSARVLLDPTTSSVTLVEGEVYAHPTTVTFQQPGTFTLQLAVSDSQYTVYDDVTVTVISGPVTSWFDPLDGAGFLANTPVTLTAESFDYFEPMSDHAVEFFEVLNADSLSESLVSLGTGTNVATTIGWTLDHPGFTAGDHVLQVTGTDAEGLTASDRITITAVEDLGIVPIAEISSPADADQLTAPTSVIGTADSAILKDWILEYRMSGSSDWQMISNGESPVVDAELDVFDPTLLRNGVYEIRLTVEDLLGYISRDTISIAVTGGMKIGHFALAFEDINVPVSGIPVHVIRSYDSRSGSVGDFGPNWELGLRTIQIYESDVIGSAWEDYIDHYYPVTGIPMYRVRPIDRHVVSVVIDGEVQQFEAFSQTEQGLFPLDAAAIEFRPINGSKGKLELVDGGNFAIDRSDGEVILTDFFTAVDPDDYRYTTTDGTILEIQQVLGLRKITDLKGNALIITEDGITNGDGVGVIFTRDTEGRITHITDPSGGQLTYEYDANGHLQFFTNRVGDVTEFKYENASFPNYLTEIVDPRGISAIASEYGEDGRLIGQTDASGATISMGHDLVARTQTITDRLGNKTVYGYDLRGNVTRQTDAEGSTTTFEYWPNRDEEKFQIDHYGNVKSMAYDEDDNLLFETIGADLTDDPTAPVTGYTTAYTYNDKGAPTAITDPNGRKTTFEYDSANNNLLFQVEYDEDSEGNPIQRRTGFTYTAGGDLESMTDSLGNTTTYGYDYGFSDPAYTGAVKSQTVTVTDASNSVLRSSQSLFDRQENQLAEITCRTVYEVGSSSTFSETLVTEFAYDAENRLIATFAPDPDGDGPLGRMVTETRYNAIGKEAATLVWSSIADYESEVLADARVTSMDYDSRGNLERTTFPDGTFEESGYDLENRRLWSRDRNGNVTYFVYDRVGRLTHTIFPDATTPDPSEFSISDLQSQIKSHPALLDNPTTETIYDLIGRVQFSIDERGGVTESVYEDDCGCSQRRKQTIQSVTDPATGSPVNLTTSYSYDDGGNLRFVTDPRGNTTETIYDLRNRPTKTVLPATDEHVASELETEYDALGRRTATIDQAGNRKEFSYDGLGRLIGVREQFDSDSDNWILTSYLYDSLGNRLAEIDANNHVTVFAYDALGRRVRRTVGLTLDDTSGTLDRTDVAAVFAALSSDADTATESYAYDEWGRLATRTAFDGYTTTYTYYADTDYLHEEIADPTHPSLLLAHAPARYAYTYDDAGNRNGQQVFNGPLHGEAVIYDETWTYDERQRPTYHATSFGAVDYGFDAAGNLARIESATSEGAWLTYDYDELNRLTSVDDHHSLTDTTYTYNANGSLETVTYGNGVEHAYQYDVLNRLRFLEVSLGGSTLHGYEYKLKITGHREQIIESTGRTSVYGYDGLHRMISETITGDLSGQNGLVGYTLDAVGNRQTRVSTVGLLSNQNFTFNSRNWIDSDTFDANGNTLHSSFSIPDSSFGDQYDFKNRLIQRTETSGRIITFLYDANGTRIGKRVNPNDGGATEATTTFFLNDTLNPTGYSQVLEEFDGNGAELSDLAASLTLSRTYTIGLDLIGYDAKDDLGNWHQRYFGYDGHGSVRELLGESGDVLESYTYDAFGVLLSGSVDQSSVTANPYLYTGERFDSDLGLYYLRARYVNPGTGRFHNMDTYEGNASDPMTLHKYLYTHHDPINGTDPSGRMSFMNLGQAVAVMGSLTTLANIGITALGFAAMSNHDDYDPDGAIVSVGFSMASRGFGADLGFDIIYERRTGDIYVYFTGAATLAPLSLFKGHRGAPLSMTAGPIFNMNSAREMQGWGLTATWPASVTGRILKAMIPSKKLKMWGAITTLAKKTKNPKWKHMVVQFGLSTSGPGFFKVGLRSNSFTAGGGYAKELYHLRDLPSRLKKMLSGVNFSAISSIVDDPENALAFVR